MKQFCWYFYLVFGELGTMTKHRIILSFQIYLYFSLKLSPSVMASSGVLKFFGSY